jgi:uncharacterized protein (UPF0147 family)
MTAMRKAFEAHFHSREQVQGYVEVALAIMEDAVVPDDLREAAFGKAVELLAQKQVTFEAVNPSGVLLNQRPQG